MRNEGFYGDSGKYDFERSLEYYNVPPQDVELLRAYLAEKQAVDHIEERRTRKIAFTLIGWRRFIEKPWRECSMADILAGITKMKTARAVRFKRNGERYEGDVLKPSTQYDFVVILKPYLLWLSENGALDLNVQEIKRKVKPPRLPDPSERIDPNDILSREELLELVRCCLTERDRAMIYCLYETGCRVGELGNLGWEDLVFDRYGVKVYVTDWKTKKKRYSRVVEATGFLSQLKSRLGDKPVGLVFRNEDGSPITRITVVRALERAAARAGISKPVNPHMLRHARATHMVKAGYQESHIKKSLWNNLNTKMFSTYVSLGEDAIDDEFLRQAGVRMEEKTMVGVLRPKPCSNCHHINPPGPDVEHCMKCGWPLTEDAAKRDMDDLAWVDRQPEFRDLVERVVEEKLRAIGKTGSQ